MWDGNSGGRLSKGLERYTGGRTEPWFRYGWSLTHRGERCDEYLPGCNTAGYFYGGIPPKGSDANFNRKEDFAESVAAYVFPEKAREWLIKTFRAAPEYYEMFVYSDYRETIRWEYVNGLIEGTIVVP